MDRFLTLRNGLLGGAALLALMVAWGSATSVKEQQRAVLTTWGKFVEVRAPGLNFKVPFVQGFSIYKTTIESLKVEKVNTYTVDNQELDAVFTVVYRIRPQNVERIFREVPDYVDRLETLAIDRFKAEVGKTNVTEIAQSRGPVRDKVFETLKKNAETLFGVEVVDFQITNIDYNKTFREANNAASTAKAKVEQAEQEKRQAVIDAERAKIRAAGEANAAIETARGQADAKLLNANAEAKSTRVKGEAEAAVIRLQTEALAQSERLVELRKAERWDGKLPTSMLSNVVPFMNVDQQIKTGH